MSDRKCECEACPAVARECHGSLELPGQQAGHLETQRLCLVEIHAFGEANSRVMDGHGQLPSRDGPNRDRHIPRLLAWKGMLQTVRNELMT